VTRPPRSSTQIKSRAAELRAAATKAEAALWEHLRGRRLEGVKFRRQHPIGPYIVDLCSPAQKLIIELDGGQHRGQQAADAERTAKLESLGYRVLRFWNDDVLQETDRVLRVIREAVREH
jgi:very-short-patch-repair endonuclease